MNEFIFPFPLHTYIHIMITCSEWSTYKLSKVINSMEYLPG